MLREIDALEIHFVAGCLNNCLQKYLSLSHSPRGFSITAEVVARKHHISAILSIDGSGYICVVHQLLHCWKMPGTENIKLGCFLMQSHTSMTPKNMHTQYLWLWMGTTSSKTFEQLLWSRLAYVKVSLCQHPPLCSIISFKKKQQQPWNERVFRPRSTLRISGTALKFKFCSQLLSCSENLLNKQNGALEIQLRWLSVAEGTTDECCSKQKELFHSLYCSISYTGCTKNRSVLIQVRSVP